MLEVTRRFEDALYCLLHRISRRQKPQYPPKNLSFSNLSATKTLKRTPAAAFLASYRIYQRSQISIAYR